MIQFQSILFKKKFATLIVSKFSVACISNIKITVIHVFSDRNIFIALACKQNNVSTASHFYNLNEAFSPYLTSIIAFACFSLGYLCLVILLVICFLYFMFKFNSPLLSYCVDLN